MDAERIEVLYHQHVFQFVRAPGPCFEGRLALDDSQRELLERLLIAEDEDRYLDDDGERLPAERLFALSPWSYVGPSGPVKLLRRFLDLRDGRAMFSTPETYEGEPSDWLRRKDEGCDD